MQRRKERQPEGNALLSFPAGVRGWNAPRLAPRTSHHFRRAHLSSPGVQGQFTEPHKPCAAQLGGSSSTPSPCSPVSPSTWLLGRFPRREVWEKSGGRAPSCPGSLLTHRNIAHSVPLSNLNFLLLESPMAPRAGSSLSPSPWSQVSLWLRTEGVAQGTSCFARCCP